MTLHITKRPGAPCHGGLAVNPLESAYMSAKSIIPPCPAVEVPSYSRPRIHDRSEYGNICTVYGVITPIALDSFDARDIVYIGTTKRSLDDRLAWHRNEYGSARKYAFMQKLKAAGAAPEITGLLVVDEADADQAERDMIQRYRARVPLLNDATYHPYTAPAVNSGWCRKGGAA